MKPVVIIGGSAEAFALACHLPLAVVRLRAPERTPRDWPGAVTIGPVSADWLAAQGACAVIEAAHPGDAALARAVQEACAALGLPCLQLVRPPWRAGRRDRWVTLRRASEARRVIPAGSRVLVTTGRGMLGQLRGLRAQLIVRRIGSSDGLPPLRHGRFSAGQGPFAVAAEIGFLRKERIDWLLLSNAGGQGSWPKVEAARHLGLRVAMIQRPARPQGPRVDTVEKALAWLSRQ